MCVYVYVFLSFKLYWNSLFSCECTTVNQVLDMNVSKYVLQLIEKGGTETKFLDCTNRFYTLVPHDFGLKKPPLLNSADVIKVIFKNVFSV